MAAIAQVEERELLKTISWFDGFVVALANPSFLITSLGPSAFSLGGWGAVILWTASVVIGALHNYIYSEVAAMFPRLSGGIAIYAHEAWKRYFSFVGPIAAFGYWIGWSVVLSATGIIVGFLAQGQWYTSSAAASSSWNHSTHILGIPFYFSFPIALTAAIIVVIWAFNVAGMRPAVWVGYVTGALLLIPLAIMMFLPYITGHWHSSNLHNNISSTSSSLGVSGFTLVIVWLYAMCWSSYGMECCATFAPEYHDTARDTPKALRVAAIFGVIVYGLLPLGAMGTFGDQNLAADASNWYTFMAPTLQELLGGSRFAGDLAVLLLIAGIVLAMNTATADGSRALYGISQDGMTIRWFGKLNSRHVPANAMTLDALLNIFLLLTFASDASGAIKILIFSNLGYVLCHVMAMSGFLLLRRDRPDWPRPIRVGQLWVTLAGGLAIFDALLLIWGGWNSGLAWGNTSKTVVLEGIAVLLIAALLYIVRVVVQERRPLALRVWAPRTPDEVPPAGAAVQ
jgi:amino acid transporter